MPCKILPQWAGCKSSRYIIGTYSKSSEAAVWASRSLACAGTKYFRNGISCPRHSPFVVSDNSRSGLSRPQRLNLVGSSLHGSRRALGEVLALALVCVELLLDSSLCFGLSAQRMVYWELHITEFADSEHWNVLDAPDDPKASFWHEDSLRRFRSRLKHPKFRYWFSLNHSKWVNVAPR